MIPVSRKEAIAMDAEYYLCEKQCKFGHYAFRSVKTPSACSACIFEINSGARLTPAKRKQKNKRQKLQRAKRKENEENV